MDQLKEKALQYHMQDGVAGKISVVPTKACQTADELSLAYTPGVAAPVLEIAKDPEAAYRYTSKGNLVAVISNGSAILGLGNQGALASKPVMEGKGVLFKRFADIDVFDIEINESDPQKFIDIVKALEPTFGGINLEDIKSPECFFIEQQLIKELSIPVMHDDQHGTAIIATAALLNAVELIGKSLDTITVVINGAGAAGISCAKMFLAAGVKSENMVMVDSKGVLHEQRRGEVSGEKQQFVRQTAARTLADALVGSDVFLGVSVAGALSADMLKSMAKDPIVFAMANPDPEIDYTTALAVRSDVIMATGRSDYPNQINNVLGFPFIFRGAMDVRATKISEGMKMAAARSLAALAKEKVPPEVKKAYNGEDFSFGRTYLVPKPFDPRVIEWEAVAVAKAACEEALAAKPIEDWQAYRRSLAQRVAHWWL
ncbi:MAG: malic enzyme-like NAD(P)-binding protein [Sphaerochaetaceae bacterium]